MNLCTPHLVNFEDGVLKELKEDLSKIKILNDRISETEAQEKLLELITWLSQTPKTIVFRVNTILCKPSIALNCIKEALEQYSRPCPTILTFPHVEEIIIVNQWSNSCNLNLTKLSNEIIVDAACGAAVLRGAHIFAPGVLGMPRGLSIGDKVSVYADLKHGCKKGLITPYDHEKKLFIGNGILRMIREEIFIPDMQKLSGIAVFMTDTISNIPQLNDAILPEGYLLLQNLPSIICSRILDPQPNEIVLDMCAAPGNKTTHISALMKNMGSVIAIEKNKKKFEKLLLNLKKFSIQNVKAFCYDSTKAVCETNNKSVFEGPPFSEQSFDKILLDGPCSALGQRPQIQNFLKVSELRSYVSLQRKLFHVAVQLLKCGGTLIYSTCTVTIAENEGIVSWALKTFSNLELQCIRKKLINLQMDHFATVGYNIDGLSLEQSNNLCRFKNEGDSVGFFIAYFVKK